MLTIYVRRGSLPQQSSIGLSDLTGSNLDFLQGLLSKNNLFYWNGNSENWEPVPVDLAPESLFTAAGSLWLWQDMPIMMPRTAFYQSTLEAAQSIGQAAQQWLNNAFDVGRVAASDFLSQINCTVSQQQQEDLIRFSQNVGAPIVPAQPEVNSLPREDDRWESIWAQWAASQNLPPAEEVVRVQQPEIAIAESVQLPSLDSLLSAPRSTDLTSSNLPDHEFERIDLANFHSNEIDRIDLAISEALEPPESILSRELASLAPAHQGLIRILDQWGFSAVDRLNALYILRANPQLDDMFDLLNRFEQSHRAQ